EEYNENRSVDSYYESMLESLWEHLASNELLTKDAEVKLSCLYNAPSKKQAECLQGAWSREEGVEVEITSPSNRSNIPRLIEITITSTGGQISHEFVEGLFRKMIKVG